MREERESSILNTVLIVVGAILVLLVLVAFIGPSLINWNDHKSEIVAAVEHATGRRLTLDGDISISILPSPRITVSGLRLANLPGAGGDDFLRVRAAEARIELAPLLSGQIRVESLTLVGPTLNLQRLGDGRGNWRGLEPPGWLELDRLDVRDATLGYRDERNGFAEQLDHVDAAISAAAPPGPFRAHGQAVAHGVPVEFDASFDKLGGEEATGVGITLYAAQSQLAFAGNIVESRARTTANGKLHLSGSDVRAFATGIAHMERAALPAWMTGAFSLDGTLDAQTGKIAVNDIDLRLGESAGKGGLVITPGQPIAIATTLRLDQVDLDKLLAGAPGNRQAESAEASAGAAASRQAFAFPRDIAASLDATAAGLIYKGAVLRQIALQASLEKGEIKVNQLAALLPGDMDVTMSGQLSAAAGQPSFSGTLGAQSDNLRGVLDWLGISTAGLPAERLRKTVLSVKLTATQDQLQLRELDANVDSTRVIGGATILFSARPAFGVSVAVDSLNLDGYLNEAAGSASAVPTGAAALAKRAGWRLDTLLRPDGFDANVHARVDHLIYRGQEMAGLDLNATLQKGAVTLHDAAVENLAGLKAKFIGGITGLAGDKPQFDLAVDGQSAEIVPLLRFAGLRPSTAPDRLGSFAMTGHVKGGRDRVTIDLAGSALSGTYKAAGTLDLAAWPRYDLDLSIEEPHFSILAALAGMNPIPAELGSLSLAGHFKGDAGKISISGLKTKSGLVDAAGDLEVSGVADTPAVKADMALTVRRLGILAGLVQPGLAVGPTLDRLGEVAAKLKADGDAKGMTVDCEILAQGAKLGMAGRVASDQHGLSYDVKVKGEDADLTPLVEKLLPDRQAKGLGPLKLAARVVGGPGHYEVSELALSSGLADASGGFELDGQGDKLRIKADLDLDGKRLPMLFALAAVAPPGPLGRFQRLAVNGKVDGLSDSMKLDLQFQGDGAFASVKGTGGYTGEGPSYDVAIEANDSDINGLVRLLSSDYRPSGPLIGDFRLEAKAQGSPAFARFGDLRARFGPVEAHGEVVATFDGPRPKLVARIEAGALDIAALLPAPGQANAARPRAPTAPVAGGHWSSTPFDLSPLRIADGRLDLTSPAVSYEGWRLDGAKIAASLEAGVLDVTRLAGRFRGADLAASGRVSGKEAAGMTLAVRLDRMRLDQPGVKLGPLTLAEGTVAGTLDLKATGDSELALAESLNGNGSMSLTDGTLDGIDMLALNAKLAQFDRTVDVIAFLKALTSGGSTRLARMGGNFKVHDGVIESSDLALDADGAIGHGQGKVDLPRWFMDNSVEFKLTQVQGIPPFSIRLSGPLDSPHKFLLANELQEFLLQRGVSTMLKDVHKEPPASAPVPETQPPPPDAEKPDKAERTEKSGGAEEPADKAEKPPEKTEKPPAKKAPTADDIVRRLLKSQQQPAGNQ